MATVHDCPFCDYAGPSEVQRDFGDAYVIEPLRPVVPGHVMVIPKVHVSNFAEDPLLTGTIAERAAEWVKLQVAEGVLSSANLITSMGKPATQSVFHLHLHVLPRAVGDGLALPWANPHELTGKAA